MSPAELAELRVQLDALLARGFITPSYATHASPILFARKPGGGLRLCVDYRHLNSNTRKHSYPLPRVDVLIDQLTGSRYFTKIDLDAAFHQIAIQPDQTHLTAFRTRYGIFEFKVMPFGLVNAPASFQSTMQDVLRGILDDFVVVYIDDLLIYSKDLDSHVQHVREVLHRLRRHRLFAKASKCYWGQSRVPFLGHVVGVNGVECDQDKVDALRSWPVPTSLLELQQFLGLANYYRRFIPRFSIIAAPLYDLLKRHSPPIWSDPAHSAFTHLRSLLSSPTVLALPDFALPFHISTDAASRHGIGAVLWQSTSTTATRRPIAYLSKRFSTDKERNAPIHLQEGSAVVTAFRHWRHYLEGAVAVIVHTDHSSLARLKSPSSHLDRQQAGWLDTLAGIDHIVYVKGRDPHHVPADALSRRPQSPPPDPSLAVTVTRSQRQLPLEGYTTHPPHGRFSWEFFLRPSPRAQPPSLCTPYTSSHRTHPPPSPPRRSPLGTNSLTGRSLPASSPVSGPTRASPTTTVDPSPAPHAFLSVITRARSLASPLLHPPPSPPIPPSDTPLNSRPINPGFVRARLPPAVPQQPPPNPAASPGPPHPTAPGSPWRGAGDWASGRFLGSTQFFFTVRLA